MNERLRMRAVEVPDSWKGFNACVEATNHAGVGGFKTLSTND